MGKVTKGSDIFKFSHDCRGKVRVVFANPGWRCPACGALAKRPH